MPWHVGNIGKIKPRRNLVQCPRKKKRVGLLKRQKGTKKFNVAALKKSVNKVRKQYEYK